MNEQAVGEFEDDSGMDFSWQNANYNSDRTVSLFCHQTLSTNATACVWCLYLGCLHHLMVYFF